MSSSKVEEVEVVTGNESLREVDAELFDLIEQEKARQWSGLELIASENFTSRAVMECMGSCLTNKYAEGYPGRRYYGGNEIVDKVERLCISRALAAYRLNPEEWGVNVQPYSGSPMNFAVYTALLNPHDRIMGLDLPSGGHLTHGYYTYSKKEGTRKAVSATSIFFESLPYRVSGETGLIDYDNLAELAAIYKPKMIVCGASAYPRDFDYAKFREIADANGALLMMDMAHISGLVATQEANNPFDYCDVVTTTTHKSLRGPRSGMIFYRKDARGFGRAINAAVFPGLQGGPHEHTIAAMATQLREVQTPAFKTYCQRVKANIAAMAAALVEQGFKLASGGTENHLLVWDLRPLGITGSKMENVCDRVHITLNKNSVHGDRSAVTPGGVRIGSPAMTTRGLTEKDFVTVAGFLARAAKIAVRVQETAGKLLKKFLPALDNDEEIAALRDEVTAFARKFPMPGMDVENMRYGSSYKEPAAVDASA